MPGGVKVGMPNAGETTVGRLTTFLTTEVAVVIVPGLLGDKVPIISDTGSGLAGSRIAVVFVIDLLLAPAMASMAMAKASLGGNRETDEPILVGEEVFVLTRVMLPELTGRIPLGNTKFPALFGMPPAKVIGGIVVMGLICLIPPGAEVIGCFRTWI